ncbi:unnamed protein product, partial [Choristocarpus tenellus]
ARVLAQGQAQGQGQARSPALLKHPDDDKYGLAKLPPDKGDSVKKDVESVVDITSLKEEEDLLHNMQGQASARRAAGAMAVGGGGSKAWFASNVVDHRVAWCSLRKAAVKRGLDVIPPPPAGAQG